MSIAFVCLPLAAFLVLSYSFSGTIIAADGRDLTRVDAEGAHPGAISLLFGNIANSERFILSVDSTALSKSNEWSAGVEIDDEGRKTIKVPDAESKSGIIEIKVKLVEFDETKSIASYQVNSRSPGENGSVGGVLKVKLSIDEGGHLILSLVGR